MTDRLVAASIATALMVVVAWTVCRLRPSLSPSTRSTIWWLVAVAALIRLAPLPALTLELPGTSRLHAWLPITVAPFADCPGGSPRTAPVSAPTASAPRRPVPPPHARRLARSDPTRRQAARAAAGCDNDGRQSACAASTGASPLAALWGTIAAALLLHLAIATRRLRRLADDATPAPPELAAEADRLAKALGLRHTPPVRVSATVETPQVLGLFRPTVLLPAAAFDALSPRERAMTLCHELAHVRRLDLAFAWAPAVMERLLFFHPGARLAAREYAFAREAACDADVLQHLDEAPRDYGRLLLRLGVTRRPAALAAAQSSPSTRLLRRRLAMLNNHGSVAAPRTRHLAGRCAAPAAGAAPLARRPAVRPAPPLPPTPPMPPPAAPAHRRPIAPPAPITPPAPPPAPDAAVGMARAACTDPAHPATGVGTWPRRHDDQAPPPPPPPPPARAPRRRLRRRPRRRQPASPGAPTAETRSCSSMARARRCPSARRATPRRCASYGAMAMARSCTSIGRQGLHLARPRPHRSGQGRDGGPALARPTAGRVGTRTGGVGRATGGPLGTKHAEFAGRQQHEVGPRDGQAARHARAVGEPGGRAGRPRSACRQPGRRSGQRPQSDPGGHRIPRAAHDGERHARAGSHRRATPPRPGRMRRSPRNSATSDACSAEIGEERAALGRRQAELGEKQRLAAEAARKRILAIMNEAIANGQAQPVK